MTIKLWRRSEVDEHEGASMAWARVLHTLPEGVLDRGGVELPVHGCQTPAQAEDEMWAAEWRRLDDVLEAASRAWTERLAALPLAPDRADVEATYRQVCERELESVTRQAWIAHDTLEQQRRVPSVVPVQRQTPAQARRARKRANRELRELVAA